MLSLAELAKEAARIARFGFVGVLATLVYAAVTSAIVEAGLGIPIAASIVGYLAAAIVSYFGHLRFSFAVEAEHEVFAWRFLVVAAAAFAANILVFYLFGTVLGASYRISVAMVAMLMPIVSYVLNRFWVFVPRLGSLSGAGEP
jgi:putative flippase GtrA